VEWVCLENVLPVKHKLDFSEDKTPVIDKICRRLADIGYRWCSHNPPSPTTLYPPSLSPSPRQLHAASHTEEEIPMRLCFFNAFVLGSPTQVL